MNSRLVIILAINLLLSPFTSSLKLPNPSPTVLIVNHLNYLRYDYLANPIRTNNYPFYSNQINNRSHVYDPYQTDNLDLILNGRLDVELNQAIDLNDHSQQDHIQQSDQLNASVRSVQNDQLVHRGMRESDVRSVEHSGQLNESSVQQDEHNESSVRQDENELNDDCHPESCQKKDDLIEQPIDQKKESRDQNNNLNDQSNSINDLNNNLSDLSDNLNNELNNLIITDSSVDQHRLLELNLLQQNEPSISFVLDADSSFLNIAQDSDAPKPTESSSDNSQASAVNLRQSNDTLNDLFLGDNISIEDNLDYLLNSPSFNLIDYTKSDDENNLNSSSESTHDVFLPANIDDLANNLISFDNFDFLNEALVTSQQNLQPLVGGESLLANNFVFNQDLCINNETLYEGNRVISTGEACSAASDQLDSDNYIHELLSDEDLQMIGFSNLQPATQDDLAEASGVHDNHRLDLTNEDRIEVSSDSAISSMSRSDWFDSGSDSSSHFDDQINTQRDRCLKITDQQELTRCLSANSNSDALFDDFELTDSNYDIYARDDMFDDQILNFEDTTSRLNPISFTGHDINQNNALQTVLHNHTYTDNCALDQNAASSSTSKSTSSDISSSPSSSRPQSRTNRVQQDSLETIRNRRLFDDSSVSQNFDLISVTSETSSADDYARSLSRDEKKAKELEIPISVCEIINMPIDEFNECLTKYELNEAQLTLIRDIRRRGKNKVAAQNCRKRKINQIFGLEREVNQLQAQKNDLHSHFERLSALRKFAENKYQKLYDFIAERSQTNAALLANFEMNFRLANMKRNSSDEGAVGGNELRFDENNTNQLNEMSSTGDLLKNLTMDIKPSHKVRDTYKKALAMN